MRAKYIYRNMLKLYQGMILRGATQTANSTRINAAKVLA
jgi:hypothetical protein